MTYHILNGDYLAEQLDKTQFNKNIIICRECLIEGDLVATNNNDFYKKRAEFIAKTYQITIADYYKKTVSELEKITLIPENSTICLWFENDLFCQTNLWFIISLLVKNTSLKVFRVFPNIIEKAKKWKGFEIYSKDDFEKSFENKIRFTQKDLALGAKLWKAYQNSDFELLIKLSKEKSDCFKFLKEVCKANNERFETKENLNRPERIIKEIIDSGIYDFKEIFKKFSEKEAIYGFGDSQLKNIYENYLIKNERI
jgi:hypothetical protein